MNWTELENEIHHLVQKIQQKPDVIIGIVRGGLIPARLLSTQLKVKKMHGLSVVKMEGERKVVTEILENLEGKTVLLVEDMLETGRSLVVAKNYLEEKGATVKTACLYTMPISEITPDYFLGKVNAVIEFP